MTKTIEELAKQYAEDMCPVGDYCGGVYDEQRNSALPIYTDDAKSVLRWLFDKPLIDRMTAEEKERVRKIYNRKRFGTEYSNEVKWMEKQLLEHLFGTDFFKKGE